MSLNTFKMPKLSVNVDKCYVCWQTERGTCDPTVSACVGCLKKPDGSGSFYFVHESVDLDDTSMCCQIFFYEHLFLACRVFFADIVEHHVTSCYACVLNFHSDAGN